MTARHLACVILAAVAIFDSGGSRGQSHDASAEARHLRRTKEGAPSRISRTPV